MAVATICFIRLIDHPCPKIYAFVWLYLMKDHQQIIQIQK